MMMMRMRMIQEKEEANEKQQNMLACKLRE